jgi:hypothetical protein
VAQVLAFRLEAEAPPRQLVAEMLETGGPVEARPRPGVTNSLKCTGLTHTFSVDPAA